MTRAIVAAFLFASPAVLSRAAFAPQPGYYATTLFNSANYFVPVEGLEVQTGHVFVAFGTNVIGLATSNLTPYAVGTLPKNVSVNYLKKNGEIFQSGYGQSFTEPFPCRIGEIQGGLFADRGGIDGAYDAAVDASGTLYIMANPGYAGAKVLRFDAATTSLVQVIDVGGYSGGLAFDRFGRLFVAEQTHGHILRFTAEQLANGGLSSSDGFVVVKNMAASYLCVDPYNRLYAVSGWGNLLTVHSSHDGALIETLATDDAFGFGIGRIAWDAEGHQLVVVYTDYGLWSSTVNAMPVGFASSASGLAGTSTVFRGWITGYSDFTRPVANSGGMARDDDLVDVQSRPGLAIFGQPRDFTGGDEVNPDGHYLSLGNGGSVILSFADIIVDGPGADFAVFENAFTDGTRTGDYTFAEFAFVEVATTTNAWARFPVTYLGTNVVYNLNSETSNHFASMDTTLVHGLAGKNIGATGTPFDLADLIDHPAVTNGSVDLDRIAFIRLVDVIGDGSTMDDHGRPIYDPYYNAMTGYPNPAAVSMLDGFDLRAVGVINSAGLGVVRDEGPPAMTMMTQAGRTYQLQYSVGDNNWIDYGAPFSSTGGVHHVILPDDLGAAMFRIEQFIPVEP